MDNTTPLLPGAPFFSYHNGHLYAENCSLQTLANQYGTPLFVYSQAAITKALQAYQKSFANRNALICYAVKANSNLSILRWFAQNGCGFDIVSGGELVKALKAGANSQHIIFSGVGKTDEEITFALKKNIGCFNVESKSELDSINKIALNLNKKAPISIRINPNIDAKTHPYISTGLNNNKFGIAHGEVLATYLSAQQMPGIDIKGIDCHIGSQITQESPYLDAADKLIEMVQSIEQQGIHLDHLDFGGGLGIRYNNESTLNPNDLWQKIFVKLDAHGLGHKKILIEPGRSLIGNAAVCVSQVLHLKESGAKNFCIVDCAMNDMPRPSLYESFHHIAEVTAKNTAKILYEVVGPICESGDWLGKERYLNVNPKDLIALSSAGAYCISMSSNYNSRPKAAEIWVSDSQHHIIRRRETLDELIKAEQFI